MPPVGRNCQPRSPEAVDSLFVGGPGVSLGPAAAHGPRVMSVVPSCIVAATMDLMHHSVPLAAGNEPAIHRECGDAGHEQ